MAHRIRLRKPWSRRIDVSSFDDRIDVPDTMLADESRVLTYRVTYGRQFNQPTGLKADDRVELRIEQYSGSLVDVRLNDQSIVAIESIDNGEHKASPMNFNLTDGMNEHNSLTIILEANGNCPHINGEVNLWIISTSQSVPTYGPHGQ